MTSDESGHGHIENLRKILCGLPAYRPPLMLLEFFDWLYVHRQEDPHFFNAGVILRIKNGMKMGREKKGKEGKQPGVDPRTAPIFLKEINPLILKASAHQLSCQAFPCRPSLSPPGRP